MTPPSTYAMRFHCFALLFGARAWDSVSASLDAMPLALVEDTTGTEQRIAGSMKNTADASVVPLPWKEDGGCIAGKSPPCGSVVHMRDSTTDATKTTAQEERSFFHFLPASFASSSFAAESIGYKTRCGGALLIAPITYYVRLSFEQKKTDGEHTDGEPHARGSKFEMLVWGLAWLVSSIGMTACNKFAVADTPVCVALLQMLFSITVLLTLWPTLGLTRREDFTAMTPWLPVSILFCGMLVSSLYGLKTESISTVVVLGAIRPIYALFIEAQLFGEEVGVFRGLGCVLLCVGSIFYLRASAGTGAVTVAGVLVLIANGLLASSDRCYQRYFLHHKPIAATKAALVLAFNIGATILLLMLYPLWRHEMDGFWTRYESWSDGSGLSDCNYVLASCIAGLAIGFAGVCFQATISATGFCAAQASSRVLLILYDVFYVGTSASTASIVGLTIVLIGNIMCMFK